MSYSSGQDDRFKSVMPDLPDDPYGRDTDLYPAVPDFPQYDYWDESNFEGDFYHAETDVVIHDRYTELPSESAVRLESEDQITEQPIRRRRGDVLKDAHPRQQRLSAAARMEIIYDDDLPRQAPRPSRPRYQSRSDRVTGTTLQAATATADVVTGVRSTSRRQARSHGANRDDGSSWRWTPIVMPSFRQMLEQAVPTLVMAMSLVLGLVVIQRAPFLEGLWAPIVLAPSILLYVLADEHVHPMWRRFALINLTAVGIFYPLLIVRQSYLRVPYLEWGNGTLSMPIMATLTVVGLLFAIAFAAAWMSQDDPEYAGVLFLPAALLVPFFAGATEIVSLRTALIIAASVFLASGVLTVVASMLPSAYPLLVAPMALALEFLVLPLSDSVPIFPMGAGVAAKLLFFVILATTVGLTVAMPSLAGWVRQVRDLVASPDFLPTRAR